MRFLFFFQKFWDIVKGDIVDMFQDFYNGNLDLYRLNFALLTLILRARC
jgi:hypothetical protein